MSKIVIVSDSKYVVGALNKWLELWKRNGWRDSGGREVQNRAAYERLDQMREGMEVAAIHIRGHNGHRQNELADAAVKEELRRNTMACGLIDVAGETNQTGDEHLDKIISDIRQGIPRGRYTMREGKLWYDDGLCLRMVVPSEQKQTLLELAHKDPIYGAHQGIKGTRKKLSWFYWEGMTRDIESCVKTCSTCQQMKNARPSKTGLLHSIRTSALCERIHLDIVGPINATIRGNRYVLTMIDAFSRYGYTSAVKNATTEEVIKFIKKRVLHTHGPPENIVTDNGAHFTSEKFQQFLRELGVRHSTTCEYNPQANGMDERFNATLVKLLRNHARNCQFNWDTLLPWATLAYNLIENGSTRFSPYAILFGRQVRSPLNIGEPEVTVELDPHDEVNKHAKENDEEARLEMARRYDRGRSASGVKPLDLILTRVHQMARAESSKLWPK